MFASASVAANSAVITFTNRVSCSCVMVRSDSCPFCGHPCCSPRFCLPFSSSQVSVSSFFWVAFLLHPFEATIRCSIKRPSLFWPSLCRGSPHRWWGRLRPGFNSIKRCWMYPIQHILLLWEDQTSNKPGTSRGSFGKKCWNTSSRPKKVLSYQAC